MLKEVYVSKPSSIAAGVKIPLNILQSLVALPTEIIKLRVDYSSASQNLLTSQKKELDALRELLDAQRKLRETSAATNSPAN